MLLNKLLKLLINLIVFKLVFPIEQSSAQNGAYIF